MIQKAFEKVIIGATLTAAASVLFPIIKEVVPPAVRAGREGLAGIAGRTKESLQYVREELEDIVAEAQFERMQRDMDKEIGMSDHW